MGRAVLFTIIFIGFAVYLLLKVIFVGAKTAYAATFKNSPEKLLNDCMQYIQTEIEIAFAVEKKLSGKKLLNIKS